MSEKSKIQPIIKIKNLNVNYFLGKSNEVRALRDVSLDIYSGEFIIFFGPSGCGKSTLLYSIAGLEKGIDGDIYIEDKNIAKMTQDEIEKFHQKKIGMIFQAYYLVPSLPVLKNVVMPQIAIGARRSARKKKALELLDKFGVKEQARRLPNELSGGQQQRVAICRSLINEPEMLFADEPVGNLDSRSASDVMSLLKTLNDQQKKTVILVTHNPAYLDYAHRVFYMKDGSVIKTEIKEAINDEVLENDKVQASISRELELLARSFSNITGSVGNLLIPFKAKQIVSEALTGMTNEDIEKVENKVRHLLITGIHESDDSMLRYFDEAVEKGGLGFDKRVAKKLSKKLRDLVKEIKYLEKEEGKASMRQEFDLDEEVRHIRQYLFDSFDINIDDVSLVKKINQSIKDRLENKSDKKLFFKEMDLPIKEGGAGMDRRTAKKVTKRLELLILGKYK